MQVKIKNVMVNMEKKISVFDGNEKTFVLEIKINNDNGAFFKREFTLPLPNQEIDVDFLISVIDQISQVYRLRSDSSSFEDFCMKNNYEQTQENRLDYNEAVLLCDELNEVIDEEWIEDVDVWIKIIQTNNTLNI